ncbi:MAG: hypothetical protein HQL32_14845 [Planctomycetes bacterium]|nr:hypothetical protein [Planctomycetota bacterium]
MAFMKVSLILILIALFGASPRCEAAPNVSVRQGSCHIQHKDYTLRLIKSLILVDNTKVFTDKNSIIDINQAHHYSISAESNAVLRYTLKNNHLFHFISGTFSVKLNRNLKVLVPHGEITFFPGRHIVSIGENRLTLKTIVGEKATLSTPHMVRSTRPGWSLISAYTGGFKLVKEVESK